MGGKGGHRPPGSETNFERRSFHAGRIAHGAGERALVHFLNAPLLDRFRKAGKVGLFGHTFRPYSIRLFVLFYQRNFAEMVLKFVPFLPDMF